MVRNVCLFVCLFVCWYSTRKTILCLPVFLATRMMLEHHIFKISVNSPPVVSQVTTFTRSRARRLCLHHFFGIRALSHFSRTEFVGLSSANLILIHQSAIKIDLQNWSSIFFAAALLKNYFTKSHFQRTEKKEFPEHHFSSMKVK